jgi:legumain
MNQKKMYKEMTVYIEACESGSMFENILEDNLNIYAVSAANSTESSWASYCAPNNKVSGGLPMGTCLGDLFSTNWMEDADKADMTVETLNAQYSKVMQETTASHVLQWGQVSIAAEPIGDFESGNMQKADNFWARIKSKAKKLLKMEKSQVSDKSEGLVNSRDVTLHNLYQEVLADPSTENQEALKSEIEHRIYIDKLFADMFP